MAHFSKEQSNGDSGVEVLKNEPYENEHGKGQYTRKIYHLGRFVLVVGTEPHHTLFLNLSSIHAVVPQEQ